MGMAFPQPLVEMTHLCTKLITNQNTFTYKLLYQKKNNIQQEPTMDQICAKIKIKSLSIFSSWTLFQWITDYLSCFLRQLFQYFSPCDEYIVDGFLQLKLISLQYQSSLFNEHFHYQVESAKILMVLQKFEIILLPSNLSTVPCTVCFRSFFSRKIVIRIFWSHKIS